MPKGNNTRKEKKEILLKGIPAAPGITIGKAYPLYYEETTVPRKKISDKALEQEIARFKKALAKTRLEILAIHKRISREMGVKRRAYLARTSWSWRTRSL